MLCCAVYICSCSSLLIYHCRHAVGWMECVSPAVRAPKTAQPCPWPWSSVRSCSRSTPSPHRSSTRLWTVCAGQLMMINSINLIMRLNKMINVFANLNKCIARVSPDSFTVRAAGERTPWRTLDVVNTPLTLSSSRPFPNNIALRKGLTAKLRPKWTLSWGRWNTEGDNDDSTTHTQKQHKLEPLLCVVTFKKIDYCPSATVYWFIAVSAPLSVVLEIYTFHSLLHRSQTKNKVSSCYYFPISVCQLQDKPAGILHVSFNNPMKALKWKMHWSF